MSIRAFSSRLQAPDMVRGVSHLMHTMDYAVLPEFSLRNGRRTDITALGPQGEIIHIEIKVSVADFRTDTKWPDYLGFCDQFYFAVPDDFPTALFDADTAQPSRTGLIISDGFEAHILRAAASAPLNGTRRKSIILSFARRAALRTMTL